MIVALIGASGFVGRHVHRHLVDAGVEVKCVRRPSLSQTEGLLAALQGCQWVVNCAGRQRPDRRSGWDANERLPAILYRAAAGASCAGMVHVSSVAAVASVSRPGAPIGDDQPARPDNPYGQSKARGDAALEELRVEQTRLCILRPPLLIGRNSSGPFGLLRKAAAAGLPLPLGGITARRSIMHVDNFAAAVSAAIDRALDGTFIVTDGMVFTPPELYRLMLRCAGRPDRCFSVGPVGRKLLSAALGARRSDSLFADSELDGSRFTRLSGVRYPLAPSEAIADAMKSEGDPRRS